MSILTLPLSKRGILKALGQDPSKSDVLTVSTNPDGVVRVLAGDQDITHQIGGGGGGGATAEEVQDFMNTALAHANHVGLTVAYDDANNRFVFTNTGGAGGASVLSRKLTLVVNGQTVTAVVKGSGSSTDLAAITAASSLDGSSSLVVTLSNLGSFKLDSVAVNVPASANAGTSFTLTAPDPTGATALADSGLASLAIYNDAGVVQAATSVTMAMSGSNLVVTKSGLVANTAYRFKVVY